MFKTFALEDQYNRTEAQTKLDLSSATPDALSLQEFLGLFDEEKKSRILEEILSLKLAYSEQFGFTKTREKILQTLYPYMSFTSPILLTTGASEAIFLTFSTLFDSGDTIIVQKPIYQSLFQIAEDRGIKIINWDYDLYKSFAENLEVFENLTKANPKYKALVINNPNNPLGIGFDAKELKQISNILEDRMLIADEVSRGISLKAIHSVIEVHQNSIAISDLSKSYSLPGLRLGWIVSNDTMLIEKFSSQKNYLSLRSPILSELLAEKVMDVIDIITNKTKNIIQKNLDYIFEIAASGNSKSFFECDFNREIICGHTIFPRLTCDESYLDRLFEEQGIFVAKGRFFGEKYFGRIRIGLGKKCFKDTLLLDKEFQGIFTANTLG